MTEANSDQSRAELKGNGLIAISILEAFNKNDKEAYELLKDSIPLQERYEGLLLLSRTLTEVYALFAHIDETTALENLRRHLLQNGK